MEDPLLKFLLSLKISTSRPTFPYFLAAEKYPLCFQTLMYRKSPQTYGLGYILFKGNPALRVDPA